MDGVFMRKLCNCVLVCLLLAAFVWFGTVLADRQKLRQELIRIHVVANSDSAEDQAVKLQVRDAVLKSMQQDLEKIADVEEAKAYLRENLPKLEAIAQRVLTTAGFDEQVSVSLCRAAFDTRKYETFTLPAGVYDALRIVIGSGEGQNWWCVAFPGLCLPATTAEFEDKAVGAGFSESLTGAVSGQKEYKVRFYFLDVMGRLENKLFAG